MIAWQIFLYTFSIAMFYALLSLGFGLMLRSVKFFNVAYGGAFLVGGYAMFLFYKELLIPFFAALLISAFASGLYMYLSYICIFRILMRRKAKNLVLLIASFGLLTVTAAAIGMVFGSQYTQLARTLSDVSTVNIWGGVYNLVQVVEVVAVPFILALFAWVLYKTRFGRAVRALEDDAEVAELVGIPKEKIFAIIFFVAGVIGGLCGIVEGFDIGIIPAASLPYILTVVVIVIIGGMKSFWGAILGGFVMAVAYQVTVVLFGGSWVQAVPFVLLILVLLFRPEGILKK